MHLKVTAPVAMLRTIARSQVGQKSIAISERQGLQKGELCVKVAEN